MRRLTFLRNLVILAGTCAGFADPPPEGKSGSAPPPAWTIDYSTSGGIAGLYWHLTVHDDGRATLVRGLYRPVQTEFPAAPAEMAAIGTALRSLNLSGPPSAIPQKPPAPDTIQSSLEVTYGGQKHSIGKEGADLLAALNPVFTRGRQRMEDEQRAKVGPLRLGRIWEVRVQVLDQEGSWRGDYWRGVWTRRDDSHTFDAVWSHSKTHAEARETVVLESAEHGRVVLRGSRLFQIMEGTYSPERPNFVSGFLPPPTRVQWEATIQGQ